MTVAQDLDSNRLVQELESSSPLELNLSGLQRLVARAPSSNPFAPRSFDGGHCVVWSGGEDWCSGSSPIHILCEKLAGQYYSQDQLELVAPSIAQPIVCG